MKVIRYHKESIRDVAERERVLRDIGMELDTLSRGSYTLILKRETKSRSSRQNRLMWLWFTIIAKEWTEATQTRYTREDIHNAFCVALIPKETPYGRVAGSTSGLTMEQMTEFLENVKSITANEWGIELPNPEDRDLEMWEEYIKQHEHY